MRSNRRIQLLTLLSIGLIGTLSLPLWRKPSARLMWNGKPAEYWIERLNYFDASGQIPAEKFLFSNGPEVVPVLIQGLETRDTWIGKRWREFYWKQGFTPRFFPQPLNRPAYRVSCARGLGLLGGAASNAVPALRVGLMEPSAELRSQAAAALGRISPENPIVVASLVGGLTSTNSDHRLACVIALTHCLPGSAAAAGALRQTLKDADPNLRSWAAGGLGRDNTDVASTSVALAEALKDPSATVRSRAAQSLGMIRHDPPWVAEMLGVALANELHVGRDQIVTGRILNALAELGPAARPVTPQLSELIKTNNYPGLLALIALGRIEPDNPHWIDELIKHLEPSPAGDPFTAAWELGRRGEMARGSVPTLRHLAEGTNNLRLQAMASISAWRLDPQTPDPFGPITNFLARPSNAGQYELVRLLGELGPAARPAVPALRQLLYSRGIMMHDYAREALGSVAPEYLADPWAR